MAISLYELAQRVNSAMPLGTIVPYYGTDEPSGWKICDGRSCAGTDLAKKLGISVVPDLRGRFIRMIGGNAGEMGAAQEDCIRNITGESILTGTANSKLWINTTGAMYTNIGRYNGVGSSGTYNELANGIHFDASRVVPTGPENRPINMAFNYIIKVVGTNVILYYVSNIIYKAKAHICRTFSFVKSFQREVRNSMSISLKNLYDQVQNIKVNTGVYTEEILFSNNTADRTLTVPDMSIYDAIRFWHARGSDFAQIQEVTVIYNELKTAKTISIDYDPSTASVTWNSDTSLTLHGGDKGYVRRAIGIIWSKAILYSFSYIIIYRLTQILLDSPFFERLSSQKGGARTI